MSKPTPAESAETSPQSTDLGLLRQIYQELGRTIESLNKQRKALALRLGIPSERADSLTRAERLFWGLDPVLRTKSAGAADAAQANPGKYKAFCEAHHLPGDDTAVQLYNALASSLVSNYQGQVTTMAYRCMQKTSISGDHATLSDVVTLSHIDVAEKCDGTVMALTVIRGLLASLGCGLAGEWRPFALGEV